MSRSCSHTGVSHSKRCSAPQMSLTSTSSRPVGLDARDQRRDLRRVEVVDRDRDALPARLAHQLGGLLDRLRPVHLRARPRVLRPVRRRWPGLAEPDGDAAPAPAGRPRHERDLARHAHHPSAIVVARRQRHHRGQHERAARRAGSAPSVSPKTRNASSTVMSGSTVARIDAVVGPTRAQTGEEQPIAPTVETPRGTRASPSRRRSARPGAGRRARRAPTVSATAAPVHTSAARICGRTRAAMPSLTRM